MRWPFTRRLADLRKSRKRSSPRSRRLAFDALEDRRLLTAAGLLDPTFGSGGIASQAFTYPGTSTDSGQLIVAEPDGTFIVGSQTNASTTSNQADNFALTLYEANGTIDTSFGTAGTVYIPATQMTVNAMALGPSGQIVVAGSAPASSTSPQAFDVAWYSATGTIENNVATPIGISGQAQADAVAIESNGQVIVAGTYQNPSALGVVLVRYNTDGSLDSSFGTAGIANAPSLQSIDAADLAIGSSGQLALGGSFDVSNGSSSQQEAGLALFNPGGSLDKSFGTDGLVANPSASLTDISALAFEANGQIVVGGSNGGTYVTNGLFALARYNTDGSLDTTFGTSGVVMTTVTGSAGGSDSLTNVEIEANGSILAMGSVSNAVQFVIIGPQPIFFSTAANSAVKAAVTSTNSVSNSENATVVSYSANGSLNTSYGNGGIASATGSVSAGTLLTDGDIVVVGLSYGEPNGTGLVAFNSSGALDTAFDGTGSESINIGSVTEPGDASATCEAIQPDGKIIVVGTAQTATTPELVLIRYNTDGSLDTTFGTGGIETTVWEQGFTPASVALQANGQIVVAGSLWGGTSSSFAVVRYNANGSVDTSFGNQGLVVTAFAGGGNDQATSVAIDSSGRIVVAGVSSPILQFEPEPIYTASTNAVSTAASATINGPTEVVVRYNADGSLDTTFAGAGIFVDTDTAMYDLGPGTPKLAIQTDGKIVVAGDGLLRLDTDGTLDATFGPGGVVPNANNLFPGSIDQLALESTGQIVVAGSNFVERFNADGSLDTTFNAGQPIDEPGTVYGLAVASDGLIAVAYESWIRAGDISFYGSSVQVLNPDGSVDQAFEPQSIAPPQGSYTLNWNALAFDSAGNIVAAGGDTDFAIARFIGAPVPSTGTPTPSTTPTTLTLFASATEELSVQIVSATAFSVTIDGVQYSYSTSQYDAVNIVGATGSTVAVMAMLGNTSFTLNPNSATIDSTTLSLSINGVTNIYVYGSPQESATLYGRYGAADTLVDASDYAYMEGSGYTDFAVGFGTTLAYPSSYGYGSSTQANDVAYTYAGAGDTYVAQGAVTYLDAGSYFNESVGFASSLAVAASSTAQAWLYGLQGGGGTFYAGNAYSYLSGTLPDQLSFFDEVTGFASVSGVSTGTSDYAYLDDTAGGAIFTGNATGSALVGVGFDFQAIGFAYIEATGTAGDYAYLTDTAGGATFTSNATSTTLFGASFFIQASGFGNIVATGTASDTATVVDTNPGDPIGQQGLQVTLQRPTGITQLNSIGRVEADVTTAYGQDVVDTYYANLGSWAGLS